MTDPKISVLPFAAPQWRANPDSARLARGLATLVQERLAAIPSARTFVQHFLFHPNREGADRQYLNRTTPWRFDEVLRLQLPDGLEPTHFVHGSLSSGEKVDLFIEVVDATEREPVFTRRVVCPREDFVAELFPLIAQMAATIEPETPRETLERIAEPGTRNALAFHHYLLGLSHRIPASTGAVGGESKPFVCFEEALALDPEFVEPCRAIDSLAQERFLRRQQTEEAVDVLRRVSKGSVRYPGFCRTLGVYLFDHGQFEESREHLERYLEEPASRRDPGAPAAFVRLAAIYHRTSGAQKALRLLRRAARHFGGDPDVMESLGVCLAETGDMTDAERCWRRVLEIQPTRPVALSNLGLIHWHRGDRERARILMERSVESPESGEAAYARFLDFLVDSNDLERADEVATEWVERFPDNWRGWLKLANLRRVRGEENAARHCLEQAQRRVGDRDRHHELELAWFALREPGDYKLFLSLRKAARVLGEEAADSAPAREAERARDDHQAAVLQALRELLERHPERIFLWTALSDEAERSACIEEATDAQRRAVGLGATHPQALHRLGSLLMQLGRHGEAAAPLRLAVERNPEDAEFRIALVRALIACGTPIEARSHLHMLQRMRPDDAELANLERRLDESLRLGDADASDDEAKAETPGLLQRLLRILRLGAR